MTETGTLYKHEQNLNDIENFNENEKLATATYLQGLNDIRKADLLSDVTIVCGNRRFTGHRVVLAASCPYLKAMFTTGMRESRSREVVLNDVPADTFSQVLEYIYTRQLNINQENVLNLIGVACILQIDEIKTFCSNFLKDRLEAANVINIRHFADTMSLIELKEAAAKFLSDNFESVIEQEEFLSAELADVIEILKFEFLRVRSEYVAFYAALKWLQSDLDVRLDYAYEVLQHIRLMHFTNANYIQRIVEKLPFELDSPELCEKMLTDVSKRCSKRRMLGALREETLSYPRWFPQESIYVAGGRNRDSCLTSLESYDSKSNTWKFLEGMHSQRTAVSMTSLSNHIYSLGGERENPECRSETLYLNEVERYSPQFNTWTSVCQLREPRSFGAATVSRGTMYVIGGENNLKCHNSVEIYDETRNMWLEGTPMNMTRSGVCVTTVGSRMYAVGGHDNYNNYMQHNSVEAYDPREGKWQFCMSLNIGRSGATAGNINGKIYLAGGRNRQLGNFFGLCECYEPKMDRWYPVASMDTVRAWPASAVLDNKFIVLGGYDCTDRLRTVEMYEPVINKWHRLGTMLMCRAGASACTI